MVKVQGKAQPPTIFGADTEQGINRVIGLG